MRTKIGAAPIVASILSVMSSGYASLVFFVSNTMSLCSICARLLSGLAARIMLFGVRKCSTCSIVKFIFTNPKLNKCAAF